MRTAVYLSVSSSEQNSGNQLPGIESKAVELGCEVAEVYRENESAWKNGHQRELGRLLDDIRGGKRKYDILLVWSLDRLSRQGPLAVLTLIDTFKAYGVKVVSVQEPFTSVPYGFGDVIYSFLAWVAKYESDRWSERTKAGLAQAVANGKKLGRPKGSKDSKKRRKKRPVVYRHAPTSVNTSPQ